MVVLLYFFGVLGNYRMVKSSSNEYFMEVAEATDSFRNSRIPKEYFWSYIYISSPLANLQNNINENRPEQIRVKDFISTELIFRGFLILGMHKYLGPYAVYPMVVSYKCECCHNY